MYSTGALFIHSNWWIYWRSQKVLDICHHHSSLRYKWSSLDSSWLVHNSLVEEILRHVPYSHNLEITNQLLFMHLVKSCELTYCTIVSSWVTSSSPSSEHVFIWAQNLAFGTTACGDVLATSWEPLLYYALPPNYLQTCYLNHHLIYYPIVTATRTCYLKKHPIHYPIVTTTGRTSSFFKLEECPGEFSSLFVL